MRRILMLIKIFCLVLFCCCFANRNNTFASLIVVYDASPLIFVYEDSNKVIHITNTKYLNNSELVKIIQKFPSEKRPDIIKKMSRHVTEDGDVEELKRISGLFNIKNENQVNGLIDSVNRKVAEQNITVRIGFVGILLRY